MKKCLACLAAVLLCGALLSAGCKKDAVNQVDLEQIDADSSNDYRHIFREKIEEGKREEERENREWQ